MTDQATAPKEKVTVEDLDKLVQTLMEKEAEADAISETLSAKNKEIATVKGRIVAYLKDLGRQDFKSPLATVAIRERWRVNLPKEGEEREAFFGWCKEQGIFEQLITVNSNTLNALYNKQLEEATSKGEGMTFVIPGIQPPSVFEDLSVTKKRKKA